MSVFSRLFRREEAIDVRERTEVTQILFDNTSSKLAPSTFIPEMIQNEYWSRDRYNDQYQMVWQDPIAHYLVRKIAENVFDDWFYLVDENGDEHPDNVRVQREFMRLNAKHYFTQVLASERAHGHGFLYTGESNTRTDVVEGTRLRALDFFTPLNAEVKEYDELGRPLFIEVTVHMGMRSGGVTERKMMLSAEEFVIWRTRPHNRSLVEGKSVLEPIWDLLIYLQQTMHSVYWYNAKIGLGAFHISVKSGKLTDEIRAGAEKMLEDLSTRRSLVTSSNVVDKMEFIGSPSGSNSFSENTDTLLGLISAGSGIPKDILTGISAGAITGAEINNKSLFATLNQIQRSVEPFILEVIRRMGFSGDYRIEWNTRFAHDEEEKARINYLNEQANMLRLQYMTVNEVRAIAGLPPHEDGDALANQVQVTMLGEEPSGGERAVEQDRNTGDQNV